MTSTEQHKAEVSQSEYTLTHWAARHAGFDFDRAEATVGDGQAALIPLNRVTVSKIFWQEVQFRFPGLQKHAGYTLLFFYLLFGSWHDRHTHRLLLYSKTIAAIQGKSAKNTNTGDYLTGFQDDVLQPGGIMEWSGYREDACRQLKRFDLGEFEKTRRLEYENYWHDQGRVYLDGTPYSEAKARAVRQKERAHADAQEGPCEDAVLIRDYLHNLPIHPFTKVVRRNILDARKVVDVLEKSNVRTEQERLLSAIEAQPQPFYCPSAKGRTVRLTAASSIQVLKREVRWALTDGWAEADLRCSQLAIVAQLWQVQEMQDFLATGENVWKHFRKEIRAPLSEEDGVKSCLKDATYSICFGMAKRSLKREIGGYFEDSGLERAYAAKFLEIPLVKTLLAAREVAIQQVEEAGGAKTPYGKCIEVSADRKARSIMAEVAQAWEMKMIAPAFRLAEKNPDEFKITLYQYDGFSVAFSRREELWMGRIKEAVDSEAKQLGFRTVLDWK